MGQIILSQVGATTGTALLPAGIGLGPLQFSGAVLGSIAGSIAGRAIDSALASPVEGPRIGALHVMDAREGAGMARVYGRMRVGGQLVWASRFRERRRERSAGKGGPKVSAYSYSISLAVAIAEGPVTRIDRVWANGDVLALSKYNWRLYTGGEDQMPDPLIEAVEGAGEVPAFKGTAYIVFEDMPLDAFGNRLPQFSFEVVRAASPDAGLRALVNGVNIIPASGEFVYGTRIVRERYFPGIERPLNMNNDAGDTDFGRSLDQLLADLPMMQAATLTVGWFGDDLRAGECRIRPGVETRERSTVPYPWQVAGETRSSAYLVSQSGANANYGGTPADEAVTEAIAALQAEGIGVTLSPFLLMDVPPGNGLPDPYGGDEQAAFPWRGRITASMDGTAAARMAIGAFLGTDHDFGYRHFILHHARLAVQAGGVETILIGSEMRGLTRLRDETGAFPFVEGLVQLAADVKAIAGPGMKVSYAADWTEYGAYVPNDGSGDVLFPLDEFWASPDVDFVGIDWYPPAGDWREGEDHLDRLAGYEAAGDPAYLLSQMAGGEAFDWYYASQADRDAQHRTPIEDTAHGEHWVFRQKDLGGWWDALHHERPGGTRNAAPTAWMPGVKPVRLVEIGYPAVDKGGNAPNLFHDPKSSESALPPYSSGERDDVFQRRALETALAWWQAQPFIAQVYVWAWDARPWPDFPVRESVWSDGPNWSFGHWLNGRTSLTSLAEVVSDLCAGAGIMADVDQLDGFVEGYSTKGTAPLRRMLEPLRAVHGLAVLEREDGLVWLGENSRGTLAVDLSRLADPGIVHTRPLLDKRPGRFQLAYISAGGTYAPAISDARSDLGDPAYSVEASLPLVLSDAVASDLAERFLSVTLEPESASLALPPDYLSLEPGDRITLGTSATGWEVSEIVDDGIARHVNVARPAGGHVQRFASLPGESPATVSAALPEVVLVDGPVVFPSQATGPLIAVAADPWPGTVPVHAGASQDSMTVRANVTEPAGIGRLDAALAPGPLGRWDRSSSLMLDIAGADLMSREPGDVLAGANRILVSGGDEWELIGYQTASLVSDGCWQLGGLLRGLSGTQVTAAPSGAVCILADERLAETALAADEAGRAMIWQAGEGDSQAFSFENRAALSWTVAQLGAAPLESGYVLSWLPRGSSLPDNWDLPDPVGAREYRVEALSGGEAGHVQTVTIAEAIVPDGYDAVRVAEIGTDGRMGHWVSIPLGAS